jgi:hypothetical protein
MTLEDAIKTLIESGATFTALDDPDTWIIAERPGNPEVVVIAPPESPSARAHAIQAAECLDDLAGNCKGWTVWPTTKGKGRKRNAE